jgi:hypothetical protein
VSKMMSLSAMVMPLKLNVVINENGPLREQTGRQDRVEKEVGQLAREHRAHRASEKPRYVDMTGI